MRFLGEIERQVRGWPEVTAHPHRFGGREFRFRAGEIGHVHTGGIVDIPFPRPMRDALLEEGLAEEHHWVPNSGWTTFRVRTGDDLNHALWLMRLSYLRYALKTAADPQTFVERESEQLHLGARFKTLLAAFLPNSAKPVSAGAISALCDRNQDLIAHLVRLPTDPFHKQTRAWRI